MKAALAAIACFLAAASAWAWDTQTPTENTPRDWQSLYASLPVEHDTSTAWNSNEHARLAHLAMQRLRLQQQYSIGAEPLTAIDLNASLFRPELKQRGVYARTSPVSPLEERLLPPPIHYAGLPDISYTMYDWINKNAFCPPDIPATGGKPAKGCHAFQGWMGALNSSHFGRQAERWYRHVHEIALGLAGRAREMRTLLRKQGAATFDAYRDHVREAEYEALAFEGYAQHFLQDRWAMGHMWERWNAADYGQLAFKTYYDNFETAAAAGLLHGSQAITYQPDPLSSPYIAFDTRATSEPGLAAKLFAPSERSWIVPQWRHAGLVGADRKKLAVLQREAGFSTDKALHPGIGDMRVADMLDHLYGKEFGYPDKPLNVDIQQDNLLLCTASGWADVIRALGRDQPSGGYGVDGVKLPASAGSLSDDIDLNVGCFDAWATNRSMLLGWTDLVATFASFARIAVAVAEDQPAAVTGKRILKNDRTAWVKITFRLWRHALTNPEGTNVARGDIGPFGAIGHGGAYLELPAYIEPVDLDELPDGPEPTGRDIKALAGLFNRAHADWWCSDDGLAELNEWRGSDSAAEQAACRLIADRFHAGTDRAYRGIQQERRTADGAADGEEIAPLCAIYGRKPPPSGYDDRLPVTLAPGYVARPHARSKENFSTQSIANWCREIPILTLLPQPENRDADRVALAREPGDLILLRGSHLGDEPGTLTVGGTVIDRPDIETWDRGGIEFRMDWDENTAGRDLAVKVTRKDGISTVGRFFIRLGPQTDRARETGKIIPIDDSTHHLGDNDFEGAPNASLRMASEGASYEKTFRLAAEDLPHSGFTARLMLNAKGAQVDNPVTVNGVPAGTLAVSSEDSGFNDFRFDLDICTLKQGSNSVGIASAGDDVGIDDFEFKDLRLELKPLEQDAETVGTATLSSLRITDDSFAAPLSEIAMDGSFRIRASGKGRCKNLKDVATVTVYVKGAEVEDGMRVNLLETGEDSSEFRSARAVSAAALEARPGQTIIVRSGLRGTSVPVVRQPQGYSN